MKEFGKPTKIDGFETNRMFCPQNGVQWDNTEGSGNAAATIYYLRKFDQKTGKPKEWIESHTCSPEIAGVNCVIATTNKIGNQTDSAINPKDCPHREHFIKDFIPTNMEIGGLINLKHISNYKKAIKVKGKNKDGENILYTINPHNFKETGQAINPYTGKIIMKSNESFEGEEFDDLSSFLEWANKHFDDLESVQWLEKRKQ